MTTSTSSSESVFCGAKPTRMVLDLRKRLKVSKETRDHSFLFDIQAAAAEEEEFDGLEGEKPVTQKQQPWPRKRTAAHFLEPSASEPTKAATKSWSSTQTSPPYKTYIKLFENEGLSPIMMTHANNSTVSFAKDRKPAEKPAGQNPIMVATDCKPTISDTSQTQKKHRAHSPGQPVAVGRHQKLMSEHLKLWAASRAHGSTSPACNMRSSITPAGCFHLGAQAATLPSSQQRVAPLRKRLAREEYRFLRITIPGQQRVKADKQHQYAHRNCNSRDEAAHDCCTWSAWGDDSAPSLS